MRIRQSEDSPPANAGRRRTSYAPCRKPHDGPQSTGSQPEACEQGCATWNKGARKRASISSQARTSSRSPRIQTIITCSHIQADNHNNAEWSVNVAGEKKNRLQPDRLTSGVQRSPGRRPEGSASASAWLNSQSHARSGETHGSVRLHADKKRKDARRTHVHGSLLSPRRVTQVNA